MADKKIHECDWAGCRKRKDTRFIDIEVFDENENLVDFEKGWLCPYHYGVIVNRMGFAGD